MILNQAQNMAKMMTISLKSSNYLDPSRNNYVYKENGHKRFSTEKANCVIYIACVTGLFQMF